MGEKIRGRESISLMKERGVERKEKSMEGGLGALAHLKPLGFAVSNSLVPLPGGQCLTLCLAVSAPLCSLY